MVVGGEGDEAITCENDAVDGHLGYCVGCYKKMLAALRIIGRITGEMDADMMVMEFRDLFDAEILPRLKKNPKFAEQFQKYKSEKWKRQDQVDQSFLGPYQYEGTMKFERFVKFLQDYECFDDIEEIFHEYGEKRPRPCHLLRKVCICIDKCYSPHNRLKRELEHESV